MGYVGSSTAMLVTGGLRVRQRVAAVASTLATAPLKEWAGHAAPAPQHTLRHKPWETGEASSVQAVWCYTPGLHREAVSRVRPPCASSTTWAWWCQAGGWLVAVTSVVSGGAERSHVQLSSQTIRVLTLLFHFVTLRPVSSPHPDFMADL